MTEPLVILLEDPQVLAVAKPAGLPTQARSPGQQASLEDAVRRHLGPEPAYLGTVHRLDRPVSGVVLWAKTPKAARRLAEQFASRKTSKEYWALAEPGPGAALPPAGGEVVWDDWLADSTDAAGVVQAVPADSRKARRAITRVRREVEGELVVPDGLVWLRIWPETGRTHQIRAQAALHGSTVVGDALYGSTRPFPIGIALHGRSLTFEHPALLRPLTVVAPAPEGWNASN